MNEEEQKILYLSLLSSSVQILESFFPHPLPAARLGLANMISLLVIIKYGLRTALNVSVLRTIISALFLGTVVSISFVLSFSSAVISTLGMYVVYLISKKTFFKLSCLGISIIGSVIHNLNQLCIIYLFFIPQKNIFLFTPILLFFATLSGTMTGVISLSTMRYLYNSNKEEKNWLVYSQQIFDDEKISLQDWTQIILLLISIIFVLVTKNIFLNIGIFFLCFLIHLFTRQINSLVVSIKKILWLLLFSFFLPLFFVRGGDEFLKYKFVSLTKEGLFVGSIYSLRLINIVILSNLATNMIKKEKLILFIKKFLGKKLSMILVTGFYILPDFIKEIKSKLKRISSFKDIPKFFAEYL